MSEAPELHVVINGYELSPQQAMTLRVALTNFQGLLLESHVGGGEEARLRYTRDTHEILHLMKMS